MQNSVVRQLCSSGVRLCLNFIAKAVLELAFLLAIPRWFWLKLAKQKDNWAITILWAGQREASVFSRFRKVDTTIKSTFISNGDHCQVLYSYRMRAIIRRSWFEAALIYKLRILGPHFLV